MSWEDIVKTDFDRPSSEPYLFVNRALKPMKDATDKLTSIYLHIMVSTKFTSKQVSELVTMANNVIREFEEAVDEIVDKAK